MRVSACMWPHVQCGIVQAHGDMPQVHGGSPQWLHSGTSSQICPHSHSVPQEYDLLRPRNGPLQPVTSTRATIATANEALESGLANLPGKADMLSCIVSAAAETSCNRQSRRNRCRRHPRSGSASVAAHIGWWFLFGDEQRCTLQQKKKRKHRQQKHRPRGNQLPSFPSLGRPEQRD